MDCHKILMYDEINLIGCVTIKVQIDKIEILIVRTIQPLSNRKVICGVEEGDRLDAGRVSVCVFVRRMGGQGRGIPETGRVYISVGQGRGLT